MCRARDQVCSPAPVALGRISNPVRRALSIVRIAVPCAFSLAAEGIVQRLTQTPSNAAHSLTISERQVVGAYDQLASIIRDRLSRRHASVLATPQIEPSGEITWSTALEGPVTREDELAPEARQALRQQAEGLLEDIRKLAASLYAEGRAAFQIVAQMLDYATRTPSGHWLYSVGGEP